MFDFIMTLNKYLVCVYVELNNVTEHWMILQNGLPIPLACLMAAVNWESLEEDSLLHNSLQRLFSQVEVCIFIYQTNVADEMLKLPE